jgi:mono/diheme cytochrome c family protein
VTRSTTTAARCAPAARRAALPLLVPLVLALPACGERGDRRDGPADAGRGLPVVAPATEPPARLGLGAPASPARVAAMDIDVNGAGRGLPPGRGGHAAGAAVYAARCASCHGARGEGMATYPPLVGPRADSTFGFGTDVKRVKTPGNYWPYATTLYDYIHRAMPYDAPGSLRPDEVYGLVAYLLAENGVIARSAVMDARTLPAVRMPARDRFVRDDRVGGPTFR